MKEFLTVAQIGCGAFAEAQDFPNMTRHPKTRIKYACDLSLDRAKAMAQKFGVPQASNDVAAVLADPEIDMIKVATTHEAHLPIIQEAAKRGIHVFCEKPMALEEKEAFQIISAVRKGNVKMCVDMNRRMAPAMQDLRERLIAHRANPTHQAWRYVEKDRKLLPEEYNAHLLISIQDEGMSYRMVHLDPLHGGGLIIGETVHWLDLACSIFAPALPVSILAFGSPRLSHGIRLTFSNGDDATILFSSVGTFDYPKEMFELTCQGALFRSCFFVENQYYGVPGQTRRTFPLEYDSCPEVGKEGGFSGYMAKVAARNEAAAKNIRDSYGALFVDKGHYAMLDAFVNAILEDKTSPCDEIDGYRAVYLARQAIESIRLGHVIQLPVSTMCPVFA